VPNYDENVNFAQGGDTGYNDSTSIQPVQNGEALWQIPLTRAGENIRMRTEFLRKAVQDLNYYADYDRALLLRSDATFALSAGIGPWTITQTGDDLWIYPALTPGRHSGGQPHGGRVWVAGLPYCGTLGVNEITFTASADHTGQRGYADGQTFDGVGNNALSLGANGIVLNLVANSSLAAGTVQFSLVGTPKRVWTITYGTNGGTTTIGQIITAVNADTTSQSTYGIANFLFASTTGTTTNSPTPFTNGLVQGGYDSEAHQVTPGQMSAFFGIGANALNEGEGLALGYPAGPVDTSVPAPKGGRRQSIWDLPTDRVGSNTQNTTPASGYMLFNTGREPEKIPGSIPIGKIINGKFVFADGCTVLTAGGTALHLTESISLLTRLGANTTPTGASLIGYSSTSLWDADSGDGLVALTVQAALDEIVTKLGAQISSNSGSRRVGAESITGSSSAGNNSLALAAGSIRQQLLALLDTAGATGAPGGVNSRVSEFGHQLHGHKPLAKDFRETTPENLSTGGASMLLAVTPNPKDSVFPLTAGTPNSNTPVRLLLKPYVVSGVGTLSPHVLHASETAALANAGAALASGWLSMSTVSNSDFTATLKQLAKMNGLGDGIWTHLVAVQLSGTGSTDGYYLLFTIDFTNFNVQLVNLDGSTANLSAITLPGNISFFLVNTDGETQPGVSRYESFLSKESPREVIAVPTQSSGYPSTTVLQEVYRAHNTAGTNAYVTHTETNDEAVWNEYNSSDALVAVRDTHNILITSDASQLNGHETGAPVDASGYSGHAGSHHHGTHYSALILIGPAYAMVAENLNNGSLPISVGPAQFINGQALATGEVGMGLEVVYELGVTPTGAGHTIVNLGIYNETDLIALLFFEYTATGAGDPRGYRGTITVPTTTNRVGLIRDVTVNGGPSSTNVNFGSSYINLYESGKFVGHV
jgi:hypothetical protein